MSALYTNQEKLEAVRRELAYRRRVFARRVAEGQMKQELADRQIAIFEAIEKDFAEKAAGERLL